jgi:multicomponent Na+:H+ antiporter subunit D
MAVTPATLVIAPMLLALVAAIVTIPMQRPERQRWVALVASGSYLVAVAALAARVLPLAGSGSQTLTYQVSGWPAPFGIALVADPLSVSFLALTAVVTLATVAYTAIDGVGGTTFYPLFSFVLVGVSGAFLTGDLFNLFVWFEVVLMSTFVLVVYTGGADGTRAGLQYVVLNLVGSAVMLLAVGGLYATTGTLNVADVARRLAEPAAYGIDPAPVLGFSALLIAVFALKAGIAPFQFWVPAAYSAAPAPVAAVLAGVVKKIGIYAILRVVFTMLGPAALAGGGASGTTATTGALAFFGPVVLVGATASVFLGGLGALGATDVRSVLAHSSIGQVGFMALPVAIAASVPAGAAIGGTSVRTLAVAAAVVYAINHGLAKSTLFLATGTIREWVGTDRLAQLGGLAGRSPIVAGATLLGGLALVGVPPLSGFFAKFLILDGAVRAGSGPVVAVVLLGSILTIGYVSRLWNQAFWGKRGVAITDAGEPPATRYVVGALALTLLAVGLGFDPVYRSAIAAGEAALNTGAYREAVLGVNP